MKNEKVLLPLFKELKTKVDNQDFVIDKSGVKVVELIAPRIELNPQQPLLKFNGRKTPEKYVNAELDWYLSEDLNVRNISEHASIWKDVSDEAGYINSNYGYLVYSASNHHQYYNCWKELCKNKESRRAIQIYTRPSMHYDYNRDGMSDFICTLAHQFFIRNNELISVVNCRSVDFIFGFFNDFYWFSYIHNEMFEDLLKTYSELKNGKMIYVPNSLHIYERHFDMLNKICETTFE